VLGGGGESALPSTVLSRRKARRLFFSRLLGSLREPDHQRVVCLFFFPSFWRGPMTSFFFSFAPTCHTASIGLRFISSWAGGARPSGGEHPFSSPKRKWWSPFWTPPRAFLPLSDVSADAVVLPPPPPERGPFFFRASAAAAVFQEAERIARDEPSPFSRMPEKARRCSLPLFSPLLIPKIREREGTASPSFFFF